MCMHLHMHAHMYVCMYVCAHAMQCSQGSLENNPEAWEKSLGGIQGGDYMVSGT